MKKISFVRAALLTGLAATSWSLSPMLCAATYSPESQGAKSPDLVADNNDVATGNPDMETSVADKNPSPTSTNSAEKSATKEANAIPSPKALSSTAPRRTADKDFLVKAAQGGMTEVELGKLAQEKATSADVKQFGSHMVMDHVKTDSQLKEIAAKKGVAVPHTLDAKGQATVDRLAALNGPAFDKAYVHTMVKAHENDATEFRAASASAQDPDVKSFAGDNVKMIQTHLSDLKNIQGQMK